MSREAVSDRHSPKLSAAVARATALANLDELLFVPGSWFCLDDGNQRVPGVRPGTLQAGLDLVGHGSVATVAGRLRPGCVAVDVDAGGTTGDAIAADLVAWCVERRLWHLARRSGPIEGRWHVFAVPREHQEHLAAHVLALRAAHGVRAAEVDLRRVVRPLSAPHRTGGTCPSPPRLVTAQRGLCQAMGTMTPGPAGMVERAAAATVTSSTIAVPLARRRRPLSAPWQAYLDGLGPCPTVAGGDRSSVELAATFQLVITGHSQAEAWDVVTAHPGAFAKATSRGQRWWRTHVWAAAVRSADTWLLERRTNPSPTAPPTTDAADRADTPVTPDAVTAAVAAAHTAREREWLDWAPTGRYAATAVLDALLERMRRTGSTTVPCPERDLLLDTPVLSRTTIRSALAALEAAGFGFRVATFRPGSTDAAEQSHTWVLDERFSRASATAVSSLVPPSFTPHPADNPGTWRLLGLRARSVYAAVCRQREPTPATTLLARAAGLVTTSSSSPTPRQLRTLREYLGTLATFGMVVVDSNGRWSTVHVGDGVQLAQLQRAGRASQVRVERAVTTERAAYREVGGLGGLRWHRERAKALQRAAHGDRVRQLAWWSGLTQRERDQRQAMHATAFTALSIDDQAQRKHTLAQQRARAGLQEEPRRLQWLQDRDPDELNLLSASRAADFARLAPPEQAARARAWQHHRDTHGTTRTWPRRNEPPSTPSANPAPSTVSLPRNPVQLALLDVG